MFTQFTHYLRIIYAVYVDFIYACLYGLRKIRAHSCLRSLRRIYADFTQYLRSLRGHENIYACEKYLQSLRRFYADFTQVYAACVN